MMLGLGVDTTAFARQGRQAMGTSRQLANSLNVSAKAAHGLNVNLFAAGFIGAAALRNAFQTASKFEEEILRASQATMQGTAQMRRMADEAKHLSSEFQTSVLQVATLQKGIARMGIDTVVPATANVRALEGSLAEAATALALVADIAEDQAGRALFRLALTTSKTDEEVAGLLKNSMGLASAITVLGDSISAGIPEYIKMIQEFQQLGIVTNLTTAELLAMSAAFAQIDPTKAGRITSGMVRLFSTELARNAGAVTRFMNEFGDGTRRTRQEFDEMRQHHPFEFFQRFTGALVDAGKAGEDLPRIIRDMGFGNIRDQRNLAIYIRMQEQVPGLLKKAEEQMRSQQEILDRVNQLLIRLRLVWDGFTTAAQRAGLAVGQVLMPALKGLLTVLRGIMEVFANNKFLAGLAGLTMAAMVAKMVVKGGAFAVGSIFRLGGFGGGPFGVRAAAQGGGTFALPGGARHLAGGRRDTFHAGGMIRSGGKMVPIGGGAVAPASTLSHPGHFLSAAAAAEWVRRGAKGPKPSPFKTRTPMWMLPTRPNDFHMPSLGRPLTVKKGMGADMVRSQHHARLLQMSPAAFFTAGRMGPISKFKPHSPDFERVRRRMLQGKPIDPAQLFYDVDPKTGKLKITGHEGRHRALAAHRMGMSHIPVVASPSSLRPRSIQQHRAAERMLMRHGATLATASALGAPRKIPGTGGLRHITSGKIVGPGAPGAVPAGSRRFVEGMIIGQGLRPPGMREQIWTRMMTQTKDFRRFHAKGTGLASAMGAATAGVSGRRAGSFVEAALIASMFMGRTLGRGVVGGAKLARRGATAPLRGMMNLLGAPGRMREARAIARSAAGMNLLFGAVDPTRGRAGASAVAGASRIISMGGERAPGMRSHRTVEGRRAQRAMARMVDSRLAAAMTAPARGAGRGTRALLRGLDKSITRDAHAFHDRADARRRDALRRSIVGGEVLQRSTMERIGVRPHRRPRAAAAQRMAAGGMNLSDLLLTAALLGPRAIGRGGLAMGRGLARGGRGAVGLMKGGVKGTGRGIGGFLHGVGTKVAGTNLMKAAIGKQALGRGATMALGAGPVGLAVGLVSALGPLFRVIGDFLNRVGQQGGVIGGIANTLAVAFQTLRLISNLVNKVFGFIWKVVSGIFNFVTKYTGLQFLGDAIFNKGGGGLAGGIKGLNERLEGRPSTTNNFTFNGDAGDASRESAQQIINSTVNNRGTGVV